MEAERLTALLESLTPERVRELVLDLEPRQPRANRNTVPLYAIVEALAPELAREEPADRVAAEAELRRAVMRAVEEVPDLRFVETDG